MGSGSKQEKEYVKAVYSHPAYLTFMQSSSWEMPDWMKHKLKSRCWEGLGAGGEGDDRG